MKKTICCVLLFMTALTNAADNSQDINESGRADLLDFFPVWLDIGKALAKIDALSGSGGKATVKLRHGGGALNFVTTGTFLTNR